MPIFFSTNIMKTMTGSVPVEVGNMRLVFVHLVCGCSSWRFTSSFRDTSGKEQNKSTFRLLLFHPFFHRQVSILSVVGTIFSFIHHGINLQIERVGIAPRLGVTFLQQSSNQKPTTSHRDSETDRLNFSIFENFSFVDALPERFLRTWKSKLPTASSSGCYTIININFKRAACQTNINCGQLNHIYWNTRYLKKRRQWMRCKSKI